MQMTCNRFFHLLQKSLNAALIHFGNDWTINSRGVQIQLAKLAKFDKRIQYLYYPLLNVRIITLFHASYGFTAWYYNAEVQYKGLILKNWKKTMNLQH